MKLILKTNLIVVLFCILLNGLYAQSGNSNSNNEQTDQQTLLDPNFIKFKLNCTNENCGFQIVNSSNQTVAVFYGDGTHTFNTYLDYIHWYWRYHGNILFDIYATPSVQAIYMNTPVLINTYQTIGDTVFAVKRNNNLVFAIGVTPYQTNGAGFKCPLSIQGDGTQEALYVDGNGAQYAVDVSGNGFISGTWYMGSDIRFKKNIILIPHALSKILSLKGVSFSWRKDELKTNNFNDGNQIGFIAQDVEKVLPELVKTDADGYKSVSYGNLTPVIVEAIKEQQKIIDMQNTQIQKQEQMIKSLRNEIEKQNMDIKKIYTILNNK